MAQAPELTIVVPMHNEALGAERFLQAVEAAVGPAVASFEVLCVDDGSRDGTPEVLERLRAQHPQLVLLRLSRNFGKEAAMWAGLCEARGRAVLFMDADLQHPPALIPEMVERWRQGAEIVEAVKRSRGREPLLYRVLASAFNAISSRSMGRSLQGASDFKLLDRQVIEALRQCGERHRFFRGLVAWVGFEVVQLPFDVAPRAAGTSSWTVLQLVRFALTNLLAFTALPLHLVATAGAIAIVFSIALGAQTLYRYLAGEALGGFTTVILLQLLLSGLLLGSVGVVALYVAELYAEAKARPLFLVRQPGKRAHPSEAPAARSDDERAAG